MFTDKAKIDNLISFGLQTSLDSYLSTSKYINEHACYCKAKYKQIYRVRHDLLKMLTYFCDYVESSLYYISMNGVIDYAKASLCSKNPREGEH